MDIHLSFHKRWVKTLGKVMWPWTLEGSCMCSRGNNVKAHWCQWIVNPRMNMATHQTGSWLARPNKKGGVKLVSTPMTGGMTMSVSLPDMEYSHPLEEGPSLPIEWWLHTLHSKWRKPKISQETRIDSWSMRPCSQQKRGTVGQPPRCHPGYWVEQALINYPHITLNCKRQCC